MSAGAVLRHCVICTSVGLVCRRCSESAAEAVYWKGFRSGHERSTVRCAYSVACICTLYCVAIRSEELRVVCAHRG